MVLTTGIIPPQPGMPFPFNPRLPQMFESKIQIADGQASIQKRIGGSEPKRVMVNNFDAAGGNACFILEEAPPKIDKKVDPRSHHIVAISARTQFSLERNQENLLKCLINNPDLKLADISYTTTARTMHEKLRATYVADSQPDLINQLRKNLQACGDGRPTPLHPRLAFVFTGMSSQYAGMGAQLFESCPRFRKTLIYLQDICLQQGFPPFIKAISDPMFTFEPGRTTVVQLAIVAIELALVDLWKSWGIEPTFVIGHSLGEYAALCVAGVLSITDTLTLVRVRASLMEDRLAPGAYTMLAVAKSSLDTVRYLNALELGACNVSCVNSPLSTVVTGPVDDIKLLQQSLSSKSIKTVELKVQHGFHSAQFDVILADFIKSASGARFSRPKVPVASTMLGTVVQDQGVFGAEYLAKQARQPVQFIDAVNSCMELGIADAQTVWLEIGPHPVGINSVRAILGYGTVLPTLKRSEPNWKAIAMSASVLYESHLAIQWTEYHRDYVPCLSLVGLPTYSFDEKDYWMPYKAPFNATSDRPDVSLVSSRPFKLSPGLHYVLQEVFNETDARVEFVSHLQDPELNVAVHGHNLENASLCPSSVFCEIAFTAANYILATWGKVDDGLAMELNNLQMERPIVVPEPPTENTIKTAAHASMVNGRRKIDLTFSHRVRDHSCKTGSGEIGFGDPGQWQNELAHLAFFVNARATTVLKRPTHHLQKPVVCKLFSAVVRYSPLYQAIDELFWDEPANEAVAMITFPDYDGARSTPYSPYWLDSMLHLAGFILNANISSTEDIVHVCNGLGRLRILEGLSAGKSYRSYVKRHGDEPKGTSLSDVFFFDGERLVAVCLDIQFQKLPRLQFHRLLQNAKQEAKAGCQAGNNATITPAPSQSSPADSVAAGRDAQGPQSTTCSGAKRCSNEEMHGLLIRLVSEETGLELAVLGPSTEFDAIGVDSILGIAIINRFNELTNLNLGASFLAKAKNIAGMELAFQRWSQPTEGLTPTFSSDSDTSPASTPDCDLDGKTSETTQNESPAKIPVHPQPVGARQALSRLSANDPPRSEAILLQGDPHMHRVCLFLIPGGAGAAARFYHFPRFASKLPVYALDSPYLHCPQRYCSTVEEVAVFYVAAIRKLQPHGPYMIAGYSAGGHHAYEIASQLIAAGESDITPGLVRDVVIAMGLVENTLSSLAELDQDTTHRTKVLAATLSYNPSPLPPDRRPEKSILQRAAAFGLAVEVSGNVMQDPVNRLGWFFSRRRNFGPNGWDVYLGPVECYTIDEATHVTMMSPPAVGAVGRLLEQAVDSALLHS